MPLQKHCPVCNLLKPLDAFAKNKAKKDGLQYRCKSCAVVFRENNRDELLAKKRAHYAKNKERLLEEKRVSYATVAVEKRAYQRQHYASNKQAALENNKNFHLKNPDYYKKFREANPAKVNAKESKRRAAKLQRTPAWLDEEDYWLIEQAYELAALRTKLFGFSWHVDHIIPLQAKLASGLHVPTNLQVIPWIENVTKQNTYEVI